MLVLSRKKNEKIMLADGMIEITIVEIRGDKVRVGVHAPKDIDVHRQEVFEQIQRGKAARASLELEKSNHGEG